MKIGICIVSILLMGAKSQEFSSQEEENLKEFLEKNPLQCPTFRCSPNNDDFENLVLCHKNNISSPFDVILKDCNTFNQMSHSDFWGNPIEKDSKQFCHHQLNRCVSDPFQEIVNKLPGEMCINNYECMSDACFSNANETIPVCQGKKIAQKCESDTDCNPGLFCYDEVKTCQKQMDLNFKCTRDTECKNHLGCGNGKCTKYGHIFNGQTSDNDLVCQHANIRKIYQNNGHYLPDAKCFATPKFIDREEGDYECQGPDDTCSYSTISPLRENFTLPCKCGLSPDSKSYCPQAFKKNYTKDLANIIELFGSKCHTSQRFDIYRCYQRHAVWRLRGNNSPSQVSQLLEDSYLLNKFIMDHWEHNHLNLIQDNDECMKTHSSVAQYWQAKEAVDRYQNEKHGKSSPKQILDADVNNNFHTQHQDKLDLLRRTVEKPEFMYLMLTFGAIFYLHYGL